MPHLKICGTTNLEDALFCDQLKVDFLGFIFHPDSPRYIDYAGAKKIIKALHYAKPVGVFVTQSTAEICAQAEALNLTAVQIYQDHIFERPSFQIIRVCRIRGAEDLPELKRLLQSSQYDYILVDAYHDQHYGGTGQSFDWSALPQDLSRVFLAGGVNISNIKQVLALNPYAIDLVSGVEVAPGRKSFAKLEALIQHLHPASCGHQA